jgi:hypothetical protein
LCFHLPKQKQEELEKVGLKGLGESLRFEVSLETKPIEHNPLIAVHLSARPRNLFLTAHKNMFN